MIDPRFLPLGLAAGLAGLGVLSSARKDRGPSGSACTRCGGTRGSAASMRKAELHRISEAMRMRRFETKSLWLIPKVKADQIARDWVMFRVKRKPKILANPKLLSAAAKSYGAMKASFARLDDEEASKNFSLASSVSFQLKVEFAKKYAVVPADSHRYAPYGKGGFYEHVRANVDLRLAVPSSDAALDEPRLLMFDREGMPLALMGIAQNGTLLWPQGLSSINLFTATSKMASPSFSLPAGAPEMGGTCAVAALASEEGREESNICSMCYALKGHYGYLSNIVPSLVRLAFVSQKLAEDGTGGRLADAFVKAIASFARWSKLDGWGSSSKQKDGRRRQELGVWQRGKLMGPRAMRGRRGEVELTPLDVTELHKETLPAVQTKGGGRRLSRKPVTTLDLFRKGPRGTAPRDGDTVGYFRIHDSGDFSVAKPKAYMVAWRRVAELLPHVRFWAPTRLWVLTKQANELALLAQLPNFAVRPSGLHVDDPAPVVLTGNGPLSAGTTVNQWVAATESYTPAFNDAGTPCYQCPVYSRLVENPEGAMVEAKSCAVAGCRVCWEAKATPVTYGKH